MSRFGFNKISENFLRLKREAPIEVGNMGQNFFRSSFEQQGFTDKSLVKWKEVQRRIPGTKAYKYPKKKDLARHKRAILVGKSTGKNQKGEHLRQSVNRSLKTATFSDIVFAVSQPYAERHNYGLKGMPQRKFMGHSMTLIHKIDDLMKRKMATLRK